MAKKEKLIKLDGYDELDGMLVPESWVPKYEDIGDGLMVKGNVVCEYKGRAKHLIIPEGITEIANNALRGRTFSEVTIPTTVKSICPDSFRMCFYLNKINVADGHPTLRVENNCVIEIASKTLVMGLNNGIIPASPEVVKIGDSAFCVNGWGRNDNNFIPANISEIGEGAFAGCSVLEVTIPSTVKTLGSGAFASCCYLKSVVIEDGLTEISGSAFARCESLTSVKIPESVEKIGDKAFFMCEKLSEVNFPSGLKSIGYAAFCWANDWCVGMNGCLVIPKQLKLECAALPCASIESITVEDGNPYYYSQDNCLIERESEILVLGCKNSVIKNGVKKIGSHAFYYATGLKSIVIPDSVDEIGKYAFRFCRDLESVVIPDSVQTIDEGVFVCQDDFWWGKVLKKVTIPKRFESRNDIFDVYNDIEFDFTEWWAMHYELGQGVLSRLSVNKM